MHINADIETVSLELESTSYVVLFMRSCLKYLEKSFKSQFVYLSDAVTEGDHFLVTDERKVRRWSADVTKLVLMTRDVLVCVASKRLHRLYRVFSTILDGICFIPSGF